MRTDSVAELMRQNMFKKGIEAEIALRSLAENARRDRRQDAPELRFLNILEHHSLGAFFLHHFLVIRQVERGRADAVGAITGGVHLIYYADRSGRAEFRVTILRIDWQVVLDL